jgi:hypothetical protein
MGYTQVPIESQLLMDLRGLSVNVSGQSPKYHDELEFPSIVFGKGRFGKLTTQINLSEDQSLITLERDPIELAQLIKDSYRKTILMKNGNTRPITIYVDEEIYRDTVEILIEDANSHGKFIQDPLTIGHGDFPLDTFGGSREDGFFRFKHPSKLFEVENVLRQGKSDQEFYDSDESVSHIPIVTVKDGVVIVSCEFNRHSNAKGKGFQQETIPSRSFAEITDSLDSLILGQHPKILRARGGQWEGHAHWILDTSGGMLDPIWPLLAEKGYDIEHIDIPNLS